MKSILVLFAHPALEKSRVHRTWLAAIEGLPGVSCRDLYELYPDFDVDPVAEQEALLAHDLVVLQFPMFWYSTPALLKQWQDLVLEHGWAYGSRGTALQGKPLLCAISTGGGAEAYTHEGYHEATIAELLAPIRQTARLCKMTFLPPFLAQGAFVMSEADILKSANDYRSVLEALRDETIPVESLVHLSQLTPPQAPDAREGAH